MKSKKRIVLAYSGGLDTSIILKWLQENYNAEVICYTADIGQEIDKKKIISNAKKLGVKNIIIKDLKDTFVNDYIFPMIRKSIGSKRLLFDGPNPFHSSCQSKFSQSRFKLSPLFSIVVG